MLTFGKVAKVQVRRDRCALDQAEGQLPYKAGTPAQQGAAAHRPRNVPLREDVQDNVQRDPAHQQRQQIPHGPAGKELLPEVGGGVGQPQQKTARHLDALGQGAGQIVKGIIMNDKMQHRGEDRSVAKGLEQAFELLVDALADGAFAEAVAAGDKKGSHQRFAVDKAKKGGQRQAVRQLERIKLYGVPQHDGQHPCALEHIEHPDGADSAGLGCFHERFLPCAEPIPLKKKAGYGANDRFLYSIVMIYG